MNVNEAFSQGIECPAFCFDVIANALKNRGNEKRESTQEVLAVPASWSGIACPVFVTWNSNARSNGDDGDKWRLRGCIGTFISRPLEENLRTYAKTRYKYFEEFICQWQ
jgi:AMMECR1 domain-containing protein